jgi:hypothetical protein
MHRIALAAALAVIGLNAPDLQAEGCRLSGPPMAN